MSENRPAADCGEEYLAQAGTIGWWLWRKPRMVTTVQRCDVAEEWAEGQVAYCARGCQRLYRAVNTPWEGDDDLGASDRAWYANGFYPDWELLTGGHVEVRP